MLNRSGAFPCALQRRAGYNFGILTRAYEAGVSQFVAIQTVAPSLGVEVITVNMRDAGEIEQSVATFARSPNGGLIPIPSAAAVRHRDLILTLAAPPQPDSSPRAWIPLTDGCQFDILQSGPGWQEGDRMQFDRLKRREFYHAPRRRGGSADGVAARGASATAGDGPSPTLAVHCGSGFDARFEPINVPV
jgi:hypothetical protein